MGINACWRCTPCRNDNDSFFLPQRDDYLALPQGPGGMMDDGRGKVRGNKKFKSSRSDSYRM